MDGEFHNLVITKEFVFRMAVVVSLFRAVKCNDFTITKCSKLY